MSRYFEIGWGALKDEVQEEIIESAKETFFDRCKEEGEEAMKKEWHVAPKDWKEAYCRDNAIDYKYWGSLDENSKEFQEYDWEYALNDHANELVENACYDAMKHLEIEVNI